LHRVPSDDRAVRPGTSLIYFRWVGLLALLLTEFVFLTVRFDTATLEVGRPWLEQLFLVLRVGFDTLAVAAAIGLLIVGRRLPEVLRQLNDGMVDRHWWVYLATHLAGLAGFVRLTEQMEVGAGTSASTVVLTVCWAGLGLVVLLAWAACIVPPRVWLPLLRRWPGVILACMAAGLAAWVTGLLANLLWEPLASNTFWLVRHLLVLFSEDIVSLPDERVIGTTTFRVEIAQPCSGYQGMGLMLVLISAFLLISRRALRFPRALWLLPLGCLLAYFANAVRLVALILLGTHVSEDLAAGAFHSRAGVLLFLAVGFALIFLALRLPLFSAAAEKRGEAAVDATASEAYLCPLMVLVGITLLTGAFSSGYDPLYPLGLIVTCGVLWHYRKHYDDLTRTFAPLAVAIGVTVFAIWIAPEPLRSGRSLSTAPVQLASAGGVAWVVTRVVGSVVVTPLVEELAFRGYLTRRLMAADFKSVPPGEFSWPSFLVSSSLFGIMHDRWIAGTIAGLFYALALYRRRKLSDAVLAHATTNALIVAYVLGSGNWSLWT